MNNGHKTWRDKNGQPDVTNRHDLAGRLMSLEDGTGVGNCVFHMPPTR